MSLKTALDQIAEKSSRQPPLSGARLRSLKKLVVVSLLPSVLLTAWWWWHFSGWYRFLANLDIRLFGAYGVMSTAIFTFLLLFGAIMVPLTLLYRLVYGRDEVLGETTNSTSGVIQKKSLSATQVRILIERNRYSFVFFCVGLVGVAVGVAYIIIGSTAGTRSDVASADFAQNKNIKSHYVSTSGTPQFDTLVVITENTDVKTYFVPLFTADHELALVVKSGNQSKIEAGGGAYTGILSRHLDGLAREEFKRAGVPAQDDTWVLDIDSDPAGLRTNGSIFFVCGVLAAVIFGKRLKNKVSAIQ